MRFLALGLCSLLLGNCFSVEVVTCPSQCICFGQSIACRRMNVSVLPKLVHFLPEPSGGALQYFSMTRTKLDKLKKGSFSDFLDLMHIDLSSNELSDVDEMAFTNLPSLVELSFRQNKLTSLPEALFDNIQSLTSLDLSINQLTKIPSSVERLVNLKTLNLRTNPLHCPCSIVNIAVIMPKLEESVGQAYCASPPEVAGRSISDIGRQYTASFEGSVHLGFTEDMGLFPDTNAPLTRARTNWPMPHCLEGDLGDLNEVMESKPEELPLITKPPIPVSVTEGERTFFVCEVTGWPRPKITWLLPTNQTSFVRLWNRRQILELREVHAYHEGPITCIAKNKLGYVQQSVSLKLLNIIKPQIVEAPSAQTIGGPPGSDLELICAARGRPRPSVSWLWKHATASQRLSTEGRYIVRTAYSQSTSSPFDNHSNNLETHNFFTEGEENSATLVIRNLTERDTEGRYICYAANRAGSARVTSVISLSKKIEDKTEEKFEIPQNVESVQENKVESNQTESNEEIVKRVIEKARKRIDAAIQITADKLRDPSNRRTASDIASLFRQPSKAAVELAKAAEVYEAALDEVTQILQKRQQENSLGKDEENIYRGDDDFDDQKRSAHGVQLTTEQLAIIAQLSGCAQSQRVEPCDRQLCFHLRYRSLDGGCNNLNYPRWGAALAPFYRLLPPVYENGVNTPVGWNPEKLYFGYPKPSARLVSYRLLGNATKLRLHTDRLETFNMKVKMSGMRNQNNTSSQYDFPLSSESSKLFDDEDETSSGLLMQWGQFLDHDLDFTPVDASTSRFSDGLGCNETCINDPPCFPILTPPGDPRIRLRCIGFARSSATCGSGSTSILLGRPQHREQLNQITAFIDASNVYGSEDFEGSQLRDTLYDEGRLREGMPTASGKKLLPFNIRGQVDCQADPRQDFVPCFKAGDHRNNENLGLISMHTIWMREHNRIADGLRSLNPHWSGDRIFQESRKIVGASMQSITFRSWLPKILGPEGMAMLGGEYSGYDNTVNPTISNEFATAAFRFGHTLISPFLFRLNSEWESIPEGHLLLHKAFFAPDLMLTDGGMDPILRGLMFRGVRDIVRQPALNPELTERLFAMAHQLALDLASLNVQRGRDHGLQHYTAYAYKFCGLGRSDAPDSFDDLADLIKSPEVRERLRSVYGHPGNIDLFVGGILEDVLPGSRMGPTFACIIADQFRRVRAGDRLWYEAPGQFTTAQLAELRVAGSSLSRVLCENGDNITEAQMDAFVRPKRRQDLKRCSDLPTLNLALWKECPSPNGGSGSFGTFSDIGQYTEETVTRIRRSADSEICNMKAETDPFADFEQEIDQRIKLREHQLKRK